MCKFPEVVFPILKTLNFQAQACASNGVLATSHLNEQELSLA